MKLLDHWMYHTIDSPTTIDSLINYDYIAHSLVSVVSQPHPTTQDSAKLLRPAWSSRGVHSAPGAWRPHGDGRCNWAHGGVLGCEDGAEAHCTFGGNAREKVVRCWDIFACGCFRWVFMMCFPRHSNYSIGMQCFGFVWGECFYFLWYLAAKSHAFSVSHHINQESRADVQSDPFLHHVY